MMDSKEVLVTAEELRNRLFDLYLIVASYTECDGSRRKGLENMFEKCYLGILDSISKKCLSNTFTQKTNRIVVHTPSIFEKIKWRIKIFVYKLLLKWNKKYNRL